MVYVNMSCMGTGAYYNMEEIIEKLYNDGYDITSYPHLQNIFAQINIDGVICM